MTPGLSQRRLWSFFWPLSLMGTMMLAGPLAQNAALARYPDAVTELAVFARAWGTFAFFNATLVFLPHTANVLARDAVDRRVLYRFALVVCALVSLPLLVLAFTPLGARVVGEMYGVSDVTLERVVRYLRWLSPLILGNGLRHVQTGLLVQAARTRTASALNVAHTVMLVALLAAGFDRGWEPFRIIVTAQLTATAVTLALVSAIVARLDRPDAPRPAPAPLADARAGASPPLTLGRAMAFFWPVAVTSGLFAFSRPILYSFAGRAHDGDALIAALKVAFDVSMLFHVPLNQFRHVFATFGRQDLRAVRRFLITVTAGTTLGAIGMLVSPLAELLLSHVIGVGPELLPGAIRAVWVLSAIPIVVGLRNYHHGLSLADRRTRPMALGSVLRNVAIGAGAATLQLTGHLGHRGGAAILLVGFVVEALTVTLAGRRARSPGVRTRSAP